MPDHNSETGSSSGLKPQNISEEHAKTAGVTAGWWAVDAIGTPVLGPYPSHEAVLLAIARERS